MIRPKIEAAQVLIPFKSSIFHVHIFGVVGVGSTNIVSCRVIKCGRKFILLEYGLKLSSRITSLAVGYIIIIESAMLCWI